MLFVELLSTVSFLPQTNIHQYPVITHLRSEHGFLRNIEEQYDDEMVRE